MHKLPWGDLSMAGGLPKTIKYILRSLEPDLLKHVKQEIRTATHFVGV
jgi:hypothetical protein